MVLVFMWMTYRTLICLTPVLSFSVRCLAKLSYESGFLILGSAFVHGLLYVAGGRCTQPEGNFDSSAVDAYDPFADSWRKCPDMSVARNRAGAVAIDNLFYVVGGSMQATFHRSGER